MLGSCHLPHSVTCHAGRGVLLWPCWPPHTAAVGRQHSCSSQAALVHTGAWTLDPLIPVAHSLQEGRGHFRRPCQSLRSQDQRACSQGWGHLACTLEYSLRSLSALLCMLLRRRPSSRRCASFSDLRDRGRGCRAGQGLGGRLQIRKCWDCTPQLQDRGQGRRAGPQTAEGCVFRSRAWGWLWQAAGQGLRLQGWVGGQVESLVQLAWSE